MDKPRSGLAWLDICRDQPGNASQLLRRLGLGQIPPTHDAFHAFWSEVAGPERPDARSKLKQTRGAELPYDDRLVQRTQVVLPSSGRGRPGPGGGCRHRP
ncbi:hypothetical protein [Streptomyces mirabilis]|uniref:hypothetical protein n=1 Tax=Streptomyces mirabilis TaxID=68239 RepID=UPI0034206770